MYPIPALLKSYLWDPTEPTATRILMMTYWKTNTMEIEEHLYYMHDVLKNVAFVFDREQNKEPITNMLLLEVFSRHWEIWLKPTSSAFPVSIWTTS